MADDLEIEPEHGVLIERDGEPIALVRPITPDRLYQGGDETDQVGSVVTEKQIPRLRLDPVEGEPIELMALPAVASILPTDFPLTRLLQFVPDVSLKRKADTAAAAALAIKVEGVDGVRAADEALAAVREHVKGIEECFEFPTQAANALHKRLTGLRGDFCALSKDALDTVGKRIYAENRRLEAVAAEERRRQQEEADRQARADAAAAARKAEAAQAPPSVVQNLQRAAMVATAPPVALPVRTGLQRSSTVERWKARPQGTSGAEDPHPATADLTPAQAAQVMQLVKAVAGGTVPLSALEVNWSYLDDRANAERGAFKIPGIEAYDAGGLRGKPAPRRRR
jgi:hypothetical protein